MLSPEDAEKQAKEQGISVADVVRWERREMLSRLESYRDLPKIMQPAGLAAIIMDLREHVRDGESDA